MLTTAEKILFAFALVTSLYLTARGVWRIIRIIRRGQGKPDWKLVLKKAGDAFVTSLTFKTVFRFRLGPSIFHALVGWGFIAFLLIDLADLVYAYSGFRLLDNIGAFGDTYRWLADIANVAILAGIAALAVRRFIVRPANLSTRETTLFDPRARIGIQRDSAIVAGFIFIHNAAHLLGESFHVALTRSANSWQPATSTLAGLWADVDPALLVTGEHATFWVSLGSVLAFLPYFPYSKHIHLFFAPLNFMFKPERKSIGELNYINLEDQSIEQFGAARMEHLGYEQIMDSYACIQCFRCQDVCPAYDTGKILSPAALEINKRYYLNHEGAAFAAGAPSKPLTDLIPEEAVWACTSCGACVDICPVGNEPMRDILDIRRNLSLMESSFPKQLETAFKGMQRNANPWNVSQAERMQWADGLDVPTLEQNPAADILWWVGCAPATDPRAQKTARAFAKILQAGAVNFAVLGRNESCTGDAARRAGREDIFFELASRNVELLNEVRPKRIVTTCPHCLHTIKNEYPAFGGSYEVIHHTQLINELIGSGKLSLEPQSEIENRKSSITYHDPCYLARHNNIFDAPRDDLKDAGVEVIEMPRHAEKSFCCGAGGAQVWKEEEQGATRVNKARYAEARASGAVTLAVACPFCMMMLNDASKADNDSMQVLDVAEIVAQKLK